MIGDPYATLSQLKTYLGITDGADDVSLADALESVSGEIESHTGRQFNAAATASPRRYHPDDRTVAYVDDFQAGPDLMVATDDDQDGVAETVWAPVDYQLEPLDGVVDGKPGWPYWIIRAVGSRSFPRGRRAGVHVTARWGWAAVPPPVRQACLILAAETHKLREAPFGVAGFGEFGVVRVRANPMAGKKLMPYVRTPLLTPGGAW